VSLLVKIWNSWKRVGQFLSDAVARIILTLFYFTLFAPFGLGLRARGDPLAIKHHPVPIWVERATKDRTLNEARRLS
jgi:hypothetical protein